MKNIICIDLLNGSFKKSVRILENLGISNSLYIHDEDCTMDLYLLIDTMNRFPSFNKNILLSKVYINKFGMVVGWVKYNKLNKNNDYCNNNLLLDDMLNLKPVDKIDEFKKKSMFSLNMMTRDELIVLSN